MATDITNVNQIKAAPVLTAGKMVKAGTNGIPSDATNTDTQVADAVNKAHVRSHVITSASDHTSTATPTRILIADANGLPVSGTNTNTEVSSAVSNTHSRSHALDSTSDHSLGSLTTNYLLKNDGSKVANSLIFDNGSSVCIGTTTPHASVPTLELVGAHENGFTVRIKNNYSSSAYGLLIETMNTIQQNFATDYVQMWKNNGVELATLTADGNLDVSGIVYGRSGVFQSDGVINENTLEILDQYGNWCLISGYGGYTHIGQDEQYARFDKYGKVMFNTPQDAEAITIKNEGSFNLYSNNITHGCTSVLPTNVHGRISDVHHEDGAFGGGIKIIGIGQSIEVGNAEGIQLHGISDAGIGIVFNASRTDGPDAESFPIDYTMYQFDNNGSQKVRFFGNGDIECGKSITLYTPAISGGVQYYLNTGYSSSGYGGNKLNIVTPDCSFDTANNWITPDISLQCGKNTYPNPDLYGNILLNTSGGNVGIGTTAPKTQLQISNTKQFSVIQNVGFLNGGYRYFVLGYVNKNNGTLQINGILTGHTLSQGRGNINIAISARDGFAVIGTVCGTINPNNADILAYNYDANNYVIYMKLGDYGLVNLDLTATSQSSCAYDGTYVTSAPALTLTYTLSVNPAGLLKVDNNGNVGIGTVEPNERIHVVGNIRNSALAGTGNRAVYSDANGNLTNSSSDATLKINIETLTYGIDDVMKLRPVKYNWREDLQTSTKEIEVEQIDNETGDKIKAKEYITEVRKGSQKEIGLIAQEVQTVIPEVIGTNSDRTLSVDYPKLISVLIGAVQDLKKEIDELKKH